MTSNLAIADVQPGMWFVVDTGNRYIDLGENLAERAMHRAVSKGRWSHAGVASRRSGAQLYIVEATPSGAVEVPWHWEAHDHLWAHEGTLWVPGMAARAQFYASPGPWGNHGVPYSFIDYGAIGMHSLGLNLPGVQGYIASTGHMICSQLVDECAKDEGVHLFEDGRWPGYVMPMDLGLLAEAQ